VNIYQCTDRQGNITYRAGKAPVDIIKQHYEGEKLEFVSIEVYEEKVNRNHVFNHALPIYMCI
jgi:hypothetical protein